MGRWSRLVAADFIKWLDVPRERRWLDVGCGTGALTQTILEAGSPQEVLGLDVSPNYIEYARHKIIDPRLSFMLGDAQTLSANAAPYDAAVSGLALNFIADPSRAVREMAGATRAGGTVAAYVWDYAGEMQLLRYFWDAAIKLNPEVRSLDEGQRSPICHPTSLASLFKEAGLIDVQTRAIDIPALFEHFDDYWLPFLGGQGTVASYAMALSEENRNELRECIRARLPVAEDGSISMLIRAWAVKGSP
ncbi:MAG: class I SAM-dependent methyltransferase [Acidobacteria bacterium]|nr:class I SAM-dependent methyltransferase [Acidobacteriota bacterium]